MVGECSAHNGGAVESSNGGVRMLDGGLNCLPNGNGITGRVVGDGDSVGLESRTIRTYKRRKCGAVSLVPKLAQLEKLSGQIASQSEDESVKEVVDIGSQKTYCEQVCDPKINCQSLQNGSAGHSYQQWRSELQKFSLSFGGDQGGTSATECCIRDAIFSDLQVDCAEVAKGAGISHGGQCLGQRASVPNGSLTDFGRQSAVTSNGSSTGLNDLTATKQCQRALYRLTTSEKFVSLCKLLSENFCGVKFEKILDFGVLSSRLREGAYEQAPGLFLSDIQQMWRKLHVIGMEMVSLSRSLAEMSRLFCREVGGCIGHGTLNGKENEAFPSVADWASGHQQPEGSMFEECTCRECGKKSDGQDCLVCDSCEDMFHVSCIKPAVTEIPHFHWYCAYCTAFGIESPHENCVVCERLDAPCGTNEATANQQATNEMEESSSCIIENGIQVFKGGKRVCCKVCKNVLESGELFRLCEHHTCNHYYHVRCLTNKQLKSYCSRWYCPCCLCRVCLTDKDDDKIVLCDACDHAFHIYCMNPPQESVPEGRWYCRKCDAGLESIRKAKLAYMNLEAKESKKVEKKKGVHNSCVKKSKKGVDRSGGVDMLLSAASAISHQEIQEQLAALHNSG